MKSVALFSVFLVGVSCTSFAQEEIVETVEQPAEFPGGREAMLQYLAENIKYPNGGSNGKCYAKFVVSTSGKVSNVTIVKGVPDCPQCDAEVIRVLSMMPDWEPAKHNGKIVNSYYHIPVAFMAEKSKKQLRKEARARRKNGDF